MMFAHKDKLKAFNAGAMNLSKPPSKDNKRKREQEEEEARQAVYKEFVDSFNDTGAKPRTWVKGGTVNPAASSSVSSNASSNRLYKPGGANPRFERSYAPAPAPAPSSHSSSAAARESVSTTKESAPVGSYPVSKPHHPARKSKGEKRSNLESFKEELKIMQEQRDHRHAMKNYLKELQEAQSTDKPRKSRFEPVPPPLPPSLARGVAPPMDLDYPMDFDTDKSTTNIFLGNLNPEMGEQRLMEVFGRYGPLASIKIMWPRNDDERSRGRNCGFVAFMHRKDAERAMNMLRGRDVYSFEMKMGWGKGVPIPVQPVYVPPRLLELIKAPPSSGLPFNAQPREWLQRQHERAHAKRSRAGGNEDDRPRPIDTASMGQDEFEKTIKEAVVKVVIPTERPLLALINRMVEFVVREGPVFEAIIMNREMNNPQFNFLFDYQTAEHVYYRWKLFSILNGDAANNWRSEDFRLFENGSLWRAPPMNVFTSGMPDELVDDDGMDIADEADAPPRSPHEATRHRQTGAPAEDSDEEPGVGRRSSSLSERQREHLEKLLKELTPERSKIGELMVWCLNHADAAREIAECLADHLSPMNTPLDKKLARLFLISDILYNCGKVPKTSLFRRCFEELLEDVFHDFCEYHQSLDGRLKAEQLKQKVMLCFRVWEDWSIYPNEFLIRLQNVFLGLTNKPANGTVEVIPIVSVMRPEVDIDGEVLDGRPLVDYDGDPLDGLPLQESATSPTGSAEKRKRSDTGGPSTNAKRRRKASVSSDADSPELGGANALGSSHGSRGGFLASKWETVDPEVVQAQAVTTSKWDLFEDAGGEDGAQRAGDDFDGEPLTGALGASNPISLVSYDDDEDDDEEMPSGSEPRRAHRTYGRPRRRSTSGEEGEEGEDSSSSESNSPEPSSGGPSSVIVVTASSSAAMASTAGAEERRAKLRELEVKVVKYQDDLEAGRRSRKTEMSLPEQVEAYRQKLYQRESRHVEKKSHRHRKRGGNNTSSSSPRPARRARGSRSRSRSRGTSSSRQRTGDGKDGDKRGLNVSGSSSRRSGGDERASDRGSRSAARPSRSRRSRSRSPRADRDRERERDRDRDRERDGRRGDRHSRR